VRINLATDIKTRTGAPEGKDARLKNAYIETRGEQSVVRKRPIAQGGVVVGSGVPQGGYGDVVFWADTPYPITNSTGTTWTIGTPYSVGDHVTSDFEDYWAINDNTGSQPPSADWSDSYVPAVPFAGTYATWNPLDKASGVGLSGSNLIASTSDGGVRSTIGKSSGKWFWEYSLNVINPYDGTTIESYGVANLSAFIGNEIGEDANGWAYADVSPTDGYKINNFLLVAYGDPITSGDVIGVALNMDAGTLTFYLNGVSQGVAYSGLTGTLYAAVGMQTQDTASIIVTANFGASAFAHAVPSGYNSGLYTT
jgi:hypothetical protein